MIQKIVASRYATLTHTYIPPLIKKSFLDLGPNLFLIHSLISVEVGLLDFCLKNTGVLQYELKFCCYLQGFWIMECVFAAIYNDFEHCRAFLLLFTMVYDTRVCFCLFLQCFSPIFSHMMLHVQIARGLLYQPIYFGSQPDGNIFIIRTLF